MRSPRQVIRGKQKEEKEGEGKSTESGSQARKKGLGVFCHFHVASR